MNDAVPLVERKRGIACVGSNVYVRSYNDDDRVAKLGICETRCAVLVDARLQGFPLARCLLTHLHLRAYICSCQVDMADHGKQMFGGESCRPSCYASLLFALFADIISKLADGTHFCM